MKLLKFYIMDFFKSYDENIKIRVIGRVEEFTQRYNSRNKKGRRKD